MAKSKLNLSDLTEYRRQLRLNQSQFWSSLGVTQSGGSRYESGRNLPKPVALLLTLRETGKITTAELEAAATFIKKSTAKK